MSFGDWFKETFGVQGGSSETQTRPYAGGPSDPYDQPITTEGAYQQTEEEQALDPSAQTTISTPYQQYTAEPTGTVATPNNSLVPGRGAIESNYQVEPYRIGLAPSVYDVADWESLTGLNNNVSGQSYLAGQRATGAGEANLGYLDLAQQGQVPSAAELQAQSQLEQAQRAALAQAATGRGGGGQQRAAILAGQQTGLEAVMQGAARRAQEQADARALYLQGLGTQAGLVSTQAGAASDWTTGATNIANAQTAAAQNDAANYLTAENINAGIYDTAVGANTALAQANLDAAVTRDEARRERRDKWVNRLADEVKFAGIGL